jgi:hypothetical protein
LEKFNQIKNKLEINGVINKWVKNKKRNASH